MSAVPYRLAEETFKKNPNRLANSEVIYVCVGRLFLPKQRAGRIGHYKLPPYIYSLKTSLASNLIMLNNLMVRNFPVPLFFSEFRRRESHFVFKSGIEGSFVIKSRLQRHS